MVKGGLGGGLDSLFADNASEVQVKKQLHTTLFLLLVYLALKQLEPAITSV